MKNSNWLLQFTFVNVYYIDLKHAQRLTVLIFEHVYKKVFCNFLKRTTYLIYECKIIKI